MGTTMWSAAELAAQAEGRRRRLLFEGRHEAYFVLPTGGERRYEYVTVNWLGDVLSATWKRLLFREFPALAVEGSPAQQAAVSRLVDTLDLPGLCPATALMVSYAGEAVWKLYWSPLERRPALRLWGAHPSEVVTWEGFPGAPRPYAVNFWYDLWCPAAPGGETLLKARERHELLVDDAGAVRGVRMTNTAHRTELGVPTSDTVAWDIAWPDARVRPPAEAITTGLSGLPAIVIRNIDRDGDGVGDSDYTASLIALQKNLNKLVAVRQLVIDLSEQPQLIVPPEYLDAQGDIDWSRVRIRIRHAGEEDTPEIRTVNWSGNLENSGAQWEFYRQEFRALTGIAPAFFGEATGGGESGYARRLALVATEAEVGARRRPWETALQAVLLRAMEMERAYGDSPLPPPARLTICWPPLIPPADEAVARAPHP